jgi:hypothetical protein
MDNAGSWVRRGDRHELEHILGMKGRSFVVISLACLGSRIPLCLYSSSVLVGTWLEMAQAHGQLSRRKSASNVNVRVEWRWAFVHHERSALCINSSIP